MDLLCALLTLWLCTITFIKYIANNIIYVSDHKSIAIIVILATPLYISVGVTYHSLDICDLMRTENIGRTREVKLEKKCTGKLKTNKCECGVYQKVL